MARKFISFLGTNNYLHCKYEIKSRRYTSKPVRYVQEALAEYYCKEWNKEDEFLVLATQGPNGSIKKNWEKGEINRYDELGKEYEKEPAGLKKRLEALRLPCKINMVPIPDGTQDNEIWKIIKTITQNVKQSDELYIDITHSFRFIPMIIPPLISFLKTTKGITLHSIHYGAFETLGAISQVTNMQLNKRIAPIRELTELYSMIEWADATNAFLKFGSGKELSKKLKIVKNNIRDKKIGNKLTPVINNIERIDTALTFNNVMDLKRANNVKLSRTINTDNAPNLYPLKEILPTLENYLFQWSDSKIENGLLAAEWSINNERVAQALTFLQESITDYLVELFGWEDKKEYRSIVNFVLKIKIGQANKDDFNNKRLKEWFDIHIDDALSKLEAFDTNFIKKLLKVNDWRNMINHAKQGDRDSVRKELPGIFKEIKEKLTHNP